MIKSVFQKISNKISNKIGGIRQTDLNETRPIDKDLSFLDIPMESLPSLSVIIPCYEMKGTGDAHLRRSLNSLANQSWKNFEVVLTDHSVSDFIFDVVKEFSSRIEINYIRNLEHRGSSCMNANKGIENSKFDYIKFLFQDDFLAHDKSLEYGMKFLVWSKAGWIASACNHRDDKTEKIYWNHFPKIVDGELFNAVNSLGCPSVLYLKKTNVRFDKRLPALMDIEYYEQVKQIFGNPKLFDDINVTIGFHEAQVTNNGGSGDKEQVKKELNIVSQKYNKQLI
jgi:glycosyltransferase involved in cell wall biosynthesis